MHRNYAPVRASGFPAGPLREQVSQESLTYFVSAHFHSLARHRRNQL